ESRFAVNKRALLTITMQPLGLIGIRRGAANGALALAILLLAVVTTPPAQARAHTTLRHHWFRRCWRQPDLRCRMMGGDRECASCIEQDVHRATSAAVANRQIECSVAVEVSHCQVGRVVACGVGDRRLK